MVIPSMIMLICHCRSQDIRHILTQTFGDLFTRDAISTDTIKNLITSRGGDDEYHERYVDSLQQVSNISCLVINISVSNYWCRKQGLHSCVMFTGLE